MNNTHKKENPVKEHLIESLRQKLDEHGLILMEETLAFTAERYAFMIMSNPKLNASQLLEKDVDRILGLVYRIDEAC